MQNIRLYEIYILQKLVIFLKRIYYLHHLVSYILFNIIMASTLCQNIIPQNLRLPAQIQLAHNFEPSTKFSEFLNHNWQG